MLVGLISASCVRPTKPKSEAWSDKEAAIVMVSSDSFNRSMVTAMASHPGYLPTPFFLLRKLLVGGESSSAQFRDPSRPTIFSLLAQAPSNPAWPMKRLKGDFAFFTSPELPRIRGRVLLPALQAAGLAKALSSDCSVVSTVGLTHTVSCATPEAVLAITEQADSVYLEFQLNPNSAESHAQPSSSPWPDPSAAFRSGTAALAAASGNAVVELVPSRLPLLALANDVEQANSGMADQKASEVLDTTSRWLSGLSTFDPSRSEIGHIRAVVQGQGDAVSVVADVDLSAMGTIALRGWLKEGRIARRRTDLGAQPAFFKCAGPPSPPTYAFRTSLNLAQDTMLVALLQAPFFVAESVTACVTEERPRPEAIIRSIGEVLGLQEVTFDTRRTGVMEMVGARDTREKWHARIETGAAPHLRVEVRRGTEPFAPIAPVAAETHETTPAATAEVPPGVLKIEQGLGHLLNVLRWFRADAGRSGEIDEAALAGEKADAMAALVAATHCPETQLVAKQWVEALALFYADLSHSRFDLKAQARELEVACQLGNVAACGETGRVHALANIVVPETNCRCAKPLARETPVNKDVLLPGFEFPWWLNVIRGMNLEGRTESRAEAGIKTYDSNNRLAIDARTPLSKVRAYLDGHEGMAGKERQVAHAGHYRMLARNRAGEIVLLPGLSSAMDVMGCGQVVEYRFSKNGRRQVRPSEKPTTSCKQQNDGRRYTEVLLRFPPARKWGEIVDLVCNSACEEEVAAHGKGVAGDRILYLGDDLGRDGRGRR